MESGLVRDANRHEGRERQVHPAMFDFTESDLMNTYALCGDFLGEPQLLPLPNQPLSESLRSVLKRALTSR